MKHLNELLVAGQGVLLRREERSLSVQLDYCLRTGSLVSTLPGIYTAPQPGWQARIRAADAFRAGCVITGAAAALITWWPECPITEVSVAVPHKVRGSYPGFVWEQREVHPDLIAHTEGLRVAGPALSVLDLLPALGGTVIDEALRRGAVQLADLWQALRLSPHRPGNHLRRDLLEDSRDEPWSEAEREAHRQLRQAGLTGWRTNHRVTVKDLSYFLDIAFPRLQLAIEIDGWAHHHTKKSFVADRWRSVRLSTAGWLVLPFAASAVLEEPDAFVEAVREAVEHRRAAQEF